MMNEDMMDEDMIQDEDFLPRQGMGKKILRSVGKAIGLSVLVAGFVGVGVKLGVDNYNSINEWYDGRVQQYEISTTKPHSEIYRDFEERTKVMRNYSMTNELEDAVEPFCTEINKIGEYSCNRYECR
ncbi:hypothetical protein HQ545_06320 [Candidatus Woesearchaeota archaeon]|nr:hypothetical protein [Candidatus Woesearchaeota archaeon]